MASHLLLELVDLTHAPRGYVVELGSVRERSAQPSSLYLKLKAEGCGLGFLTVDCAERSWRLAQSYVGQCAVLDTAEHFLERFDSPISVLYLDNFDYPYSARHAEDLNRRAASDYSARGEEITREKSVAAHYRQFLLALPKLTDPCWVIVDNTHRSPFLSRFVKPWFGKGELVVAEGLRRGFAIGAEGLGGVLLERRRLGRRERWLQLLLSGARVRLLYDIQRMRPPAWVQPNSVQPL